MIRYADENEARIDRQDEQEQEAYSARYDEALALQETEWKEDGCGYEFKPDHILAHKAAQAWIDTRGVK